MTTRRDFVVASVVAGGGLLVGFRWSGRAGASAGTATTFRPNAWVRIEPDGRIVLVIGRTEMGQGVRTSLAKILAEELDVDLDRVELEQASPGPEYPDLGTGGSSSVMDGWDPLRVAGASARAMLVAAAAAQWSVEPSRCTTELGRVRGPDGRSAAYGELAAEAARQPVPSEPPLKPARARGLVGHPTPRLDGPAVVTGRARYGLDVRLPGMLVAVIARPPTFGATVASFDDAQALAIEGVVRCFAVPSGVAVVARSTWAAVAGRRALTARWQDGPGASFASSAHARDLLQAAEEAGVTTRREGGGRAALATAARRLNATYQYPFSAHGAIEPVTATARVTAERCEIWSPTQTPGAVQYFAARALGLDREAVTVHVTLAGGGFGRRLGWDFDMEAVEIARHVGTPVQLVWTREDDLVHGYFQAASAHRLEAGLDGRGRVVAWDHRKASTPHNARRQPTAAQLADPAFLADSSWGVVDQPYAFPALQTSYRAVEAPVPIGPWRAVFAPSSVFARECFLDEIAVATDVDPLALRMDLLGASDPAVPARVTPHETPIDRRRLRAVLETAAERAGWSLPLLPGRARGIAGDVFHTETYVAHVVEVARRPDAGAGQLPFTIERVVVAIDCGVVIDTDGVTQQAESGVLWSLSNALGETTFEGGRAQEQNFNTFRVARLSDTPRAIETHIVASDDPRPHGLGEPVVNSFAPALLNALARLTGQRIRRLPLQVSDFG
jgi:isoquinoline 1-oxidoreductase beta subunit